MAERAIMHDGIHDEAIYTPGEIAQLTKCSTTTVRRAIKDGSLTARRRSARLIIIKGADARQWIESFPLIGSGNTGGSGASSGMKGRSAEDTAFLSVVRGQN